jgi:hypothetical protein
MDYSKFALQKGKCTEFFIISRKHENRPINSATWDVEIRKITDGSQSSSKVTNPACLYGQGC